MIVYSLNQPNRRLEAFAHEDQDPATHLMLSQDQTIPGVHHQQRHKRHLCEWKASLSLPLCLWSSISNWSSMRRQKNAVLNGKPIPFCIVPTIGLGRKEQLKSRCKVVFPCVIQYFHASQIFARHHGLTHYWAIIFKTPIILIHIHSCLDYDGNQIPMWKHDATIECHWRKLSLIPSLISYFP